MKFILSYEDFLQEAFKHKKMQKSVKVIITNDDIRGRNNVPGNGLSSCNDLTCMDARYKPGE